MEIWKDIKDYEGLYQISNLGNVKSLDRRVNDYRGAAARIKKGRILKPNLDSQKYYYYVTLVKNQKRKNYYIHRLVASAFIENNDKNKKIVNHKDFNMKNNNALNLEWVTQKENVNYSIEHLKKPKGITHTNTGEKYISFREKTKAYRITINKKEYGTTKTLKEAIKKRNEVLNEINTIK